jgi:hypothetical protein
MEQANDIPTEENLLRPARITLSYDNLINLDEDKKKEEGDVSAKEEEEVLNGSRSNIDLRIEPFEFSLGFREIDFLKSL